MDNWTEVKQVAEHSADVYRSHRGKQQAGEGPEIDGGPVNIIDVLDHITAAQETLAISQ